MKYFILTVVVFTIFSCDSINEAKTEQKRKDAIIPILIFVMNTPKREVSSIGCEEGQGGINTNLKSIDIYFNNSFFLNSALNEFGDISLGICENRGKYWISLTENPKLKTLTVYYKVSMFPGSNSEYTGVRIDFKDNTFKEYPMNFNGDPDTFTEFTAGEYRFVAVR